MNPGKRTTVILAILFRLCTGAMAQVAVTGMEQLTTHPAEDFEPSLSPNGRWIAFVSGRSGNLDLWFKSRDTRRLVQLTFHQAEDSQPVWSPDGKRIAFFSRRRDARGDIWVLDVDLSGRDTPDKEAMQLTQYLGIDRDPCFSPDGSFLIFASDRDGRLNIWGKDLDSGESVQITRDGGWDPAVSPDGTMILYTSPAGGKGTRICMIPMKRQGSKNPGDGIPLTDGKSLDGQACWSPDGSSAVFIRRDRDTDGDASVTPDDNGALWIKTLPVNEIAVGEGAIHGKEIQITTEVHDDVSPTWALQSEVIFSSRRGDAADVWITPAGGLFPPLDSAVEQYIQVLEKSGESETREAVFQTILGYQRVIDYFPGDSVWAAKALIHIGEQYQVLDDPRAYDCYRNVEIRYPARTVEIARARMKQATLNILPVEDRLRICLDVIDTFPEQRMVAAETWILLGDIYSELGETAQSLTAYDRVVQSYSEPAMRNWRAMAHLKIGDLFREQNQEATARQSYFQVLREFGDVPLWRRRASERLLGRIRGEPAEQIQEYQRVIQQAGDFRSLAVEAQIAIAGLLAARGEKAQAIRELNQVEKMAPDLSWAHAKARIQQARLYGETGDELRGLLLLESVSETYRTVDGGRWAMQAEEELFSLLLNSADRLKLAGDHVLARTRYNRAVQLKPENLEAHRGYIETSNFTGKIEAVIREYADKVEERPKDPVLLYGFGLALSYQGEEDSGQLEVSNSVLGRALNEDYRMVYPYLTMSYNYELLERLQEEKLARKPGFFVRAGRTLIAPLRWLVGLLPFGGGDSEVTGYYEKAIQALTTAVEINDEARYPLMEVRLLQNLANNFYHLGEYGYARAYRYYQRRLSLNAAFQHPLEKAVFFERAGHCGVVIADTGASGFLEEAIRIYRELGKDRDALRNKKMLAFHSHLSEQYEEAIQHYQEIVVEDEKLEAWEEVVRDYRNIAYNYHLMGEPADALRYARSAESVIERLKVPIDPPKKSALRVEVLGFSIPVWGMEEIGGASSEGFTLADELAFVYSLIGRSLEGIKDYAQAVSYEKMRLELFRKRKDKLAQRIALNRLGKLYYKMAQYDLAKDYFIQCWEACGEARDGSGSVVSALNLGMTAAVLDVIQDNGSFTDQALACLRREQKRLSEERPEGDRSRVLVANLQGTLLLIKAHRELDQEGEDPNVSSTLRSMGILEQAAGYFSQGLDEARRGGHRSEQGIILKNLAETSLVLREDTTAFRYLKESRSIFQSRGETVYLWRILNSMAGIVARADGGSLDMESASELYLQAMDMLENLPANPETSEERVSDRQERWQVYVDAAMYFAGKGLWEKALETVERGRQQEAADFLARRPPGLKRERHKIAWSNCRYLQNRLYEVRRLQLQEEERGAGTLEIEVIKGEAALLQKELDDLAEEIREEDGVLAYMTGTGLFDLTDIQERLEEGEGALCYLAGERRSLVWSVDRDTVHATWIPAGKDSLSHWARQFMKRVVADSGWSENADLLSRYLISPLGEFLENKKRLIVVPDPCLGECPFGLLPLNGDRLMDRRTLVFSSSLQMYRLAWNRRKINQEEGVLIGDNQDRVFLDVMKGPVRIKRDLVGAEATPGTVARAVQSTDMFHGGRWMIYQNEDPLMSSWVLFSRTRDNGFLRAGDTFEWDTRSSLCVLPPHVRETDRGWRGPSMYVMGLLYAGVPTVILPFWPLDREDQLVFAGTFYPLLEEHSVADALTMSQRILKDRGQPPRVWAGYQLIGYQGMDPAQRVIFARNNLVDMLRRGLAYRERGEYSEAVERFERALDLSEAIGDVVSTRRIYYIIIDTGNEGGLWSSAIVYQKKLKEQSKRENDRETLLWSLQNLYAFYWHDGQYDAAAREKEEEIQLIREEDTPGRLAAAYRELGLVRSEGREFDAAIGALNRALDFYENTEDRPQLARTLLMRSRVELDADRYWQARDDLLRVISLLGEPDVEGDEKARIQRDLVSAYQLAGVACENLTRYEEALVHQKRGLAMIDPDKNPVLKAQGHQYLANIHWKMGNYRQALADQQTALGTFERTGNTRLLALAHSTLGLIYMSLGDITRAENLEQEALDLAEAAGSEADQATVLKNLGLISLRREAVDRAYNYFLEASRIDSMLDFRRGLAYDYRNMGSLLTRLDRSDEAVQWLRKALNLSREIGDRLNEIQSLYGLGQAYAQTDRLPRAMAVLDSSINGASELQTPDLLWRAYRLRAGVLSRMGQNRQALDDYQKAVDVVEKMRAELKVEAFKQGFLDDKMDLYVDVIQHLLDIGEREEAFFFAERAKSRNFIDMLGNRQLDLSSVQEERLEEEREARLSVQEAQEMVSVFALRKGPLLKADLEEKAYWQETLSRRRDQLEELRIQIQADNPELASLISVDPDRAEKIQIRLPVDALVVEYFVSRDAIMIWTVNRRQVRVHKQDVSSSELETLVRSFRKTLQAHLSVEEESRRLYDILIAPIEGEMDGATHLILVPHGVLHYVPFAALQGGDGSFLLEKASLSLAPSATVLGYCIDKRDRRPERDGPVRVMALSNPDLGHPRYDLPFAEKEVLSLQRTYSQVSAYYGNEATEYVARQHMGSHDIIHMASHAEYEPEAPLFSALMLAPSKSQDGRLEAHEIFGLQLQCDLVTLSACETGLGEVTKGDEIIGLSRSFIFAGAPSVITSLWKVDDLATAVMIKRFYRYLSRNRSMGEALQQAQLFVKNSINAHPAAWAAFTITGDFR
jgi:CHAT domain-containing protein/Tfp pilus assembly protein PilF